MSDINAVQWFSYNGALLPKTPPHHNIELTKNEQHNLLATYNPYFIRWTSHFDTLDETSFWYILKDSPEELSEYSSKIRNQIKKGLRLCRIEKTDSSTIINEGYVVYKAAFDHYQTLQKPLNREDFQRSLTSLDHAWEFWSIRNDNGKMIGYSQNYIADNTCNYSTVKLHPDFLPLYPAYALFFTMNEHYLNSRKMAYIHDGTRSLAHQSNIQSFLIQKFHFRQAFCHLHVAYRRDIAIVVALLYPFRHLIKRLSNPLFQKISVLLKHEEIRRTDGQ